MVDRMPAGVPSLSVQTPLSAHVRLAGFQGPLTNVTSCPGQGYEARLGEDAGSLVPTAHVEASKDGF